MVADSRSATRPRLTRPLAMLGLVELWSGDAAAAAARFAEAEGIADAADRGEPAHEWWRAEQVEALLELGRVDDAVVRLDAWEADARRLGRELGARARRRAAAGSSPRRAATSRARVALLDDARRRGTRRSAIPSGARAPCSRSASFGGARGRSAPPREAIEAARAGFEELGAAGWAARAASELGADRRPHAQPRA